FGKDTFILLLISLQTESNSAGLADFKSSEVKLASVMLALKMPSLNLASLLAFAASVVELGEPAIVADLFFISLISV
ncbi:hypothetical protein OFP26_32540, partial [Escherichia coli]|nr:hypothetical protein [Escherichia coli]